MKIKSLFILLILGACTSSNKEPNRQAQNDKSVSERSRSIDELCEIELNLLTDSLSNWRIPFDSIHNMDEYIAAAHIQRSKYYQSAEYKQQPIVNIFDSLSKYDDNHSRLDSIMKGYNPHPRIYPYVEINNIKVRLNQLRKISSVGYYTHGEEVIMLFCSSAENLKLDSTYYYVYDFFRNYTISNPPPSYEISQVHGPIVNLDMTGDNFSSLQSVIQEISLAYIDALNDRFKEESGKEICQIEYSTLLKLKQNIPLRIHLMKYWSPVNEKNE